MLLDARYQLVVNFFCLLVGAEQLVDVFFLLCARVGNFVDKSGVGGHKNGNNAEGH